MKQLSSTERRKMQYRFALLYVVSMVLLGIIFAVLWTSFKSPSSISLEGNRNTSDDKHQLLGNIKVIHTIFSRLQDLDNKQAILINEPGSQPAVELIRKEINLNETLLASTIDSIDALKGVSLSQSAIADLDSISSLFKKVISNRHTVDAALFALSGEKNDIPAERQESLKLRTDLFNRDSKILALETEVKTLRKNSTPGAITGNVKETDQQPGALQMEIQKLQTRNSDLTSTNVALTKNINSLTAQLDESKTASTRSEKDQKNNNTKSENLENKLAELEAKLLLAKVDCGLSRADAKQIISNSRQRKDILQQSLTSLNTLSNSPDQEIRRLVKEKMSQLQTIAATIRD